MTKLDLALFKKIQNGHSRLPVDGTDTEFSVITASGKQYSFINGTEDKSFKKPQTFFDLINDLRQKYYTNSKM
ncbi:MAG: hypothetical protein LBG19_09195 [Prevotellaceae bacterium]|jgi:hypothetical protein|nr:hypothetical protein [Prevotellaceae bacterium]